MYIANTNENFCIAIRNRKFYKLWWYRVFLHIIISGSDVYYERISSTNSLLSADYLNTTCKLMRDLLFEPLIFVGG